MIEYDSLTVGIPFELKKNVPMFNIHQILKVSFIKNY